MKHRRRKVMLGILAMIGILFLCSACNAPMPPDSEKIITAYFKKFPSQQNEGRHHLSVAFSSLLDDRVRISMPEGTERPTDRQLKQLYTGSITLLSDKLLWAKDDDILVLSARDMLMSGSGDIGLDARQYLEEYNTADQYTVQISNAQNAHSTALLKKKSIEKDSYFGCYRILSGLTAGADGRLIHLNLDLYTLDSTRLHFYKKLGEEIFSTILPGERKLQTQGVAVSFQKVTVQLLPNYIYFYSGKQKVPNNYLAPKKNAMKYRNVMVESHFITSIAQTDRLYREMRIEFGNNLHVQPPNNVLTILAPIDDVILGKPVQWQHLQNSTTMFLETVVPLGGSRTVRIQIGSTDEAVLWEMLEIARTLRESE